MFVTPKKKQEKNLFSGRVQNSFISLVEMLPKKQRKKTTAEITQRRQLLLYDNAKVVGGGAAAAVDFIPVSELQRHRANI